MKKVYFWVAQSDDKNWDDKSETTFASAEDCYNDMRNHALEKMKWNTQFSEDFSIHGFDIPNYNFQDQCIGYDVQFMPNKIIHTSYSGKYTYEMKEKIGIWEEMAWDGYERYDAFVDMVKTYYSSGRDEDAYEVEDIINKGIIEIIKQIENRKK